MRQTLLVSMLPTVAVSACGAEGEPDSPSRDARAYYESLDLDAPGAATRTFVDAFARAASRRCG